MELAEAGEAAALAQKIKLSTIAEALGVSTATVSLALRDSPLVADQTRRTKDFVAALGLPWDAACLSPEASRRAVLTASTDQVRRKVYGGSSEGWRRYEPYAGAWLNRLEGIQAP